MFFYKKSSHLSGLSIGIVTFENYEPLIFADLR